MLTHEAYLNTLESLRSTTAEWRAVLAGMLVLRLVDSWLDDDPALVVKDFTGLQAVREALAGVGERDPVRPMLCELIDVVTQSDRATVSSIESLMSEYGQTLHGKNQWTLALDVFASLLSHALAVQDDMIIMNAARWLAFVLKELGQLEAADSAYALVFQRSSCTYKPELYLSARIGFSENLARHGRLAEAESVINTVVRETSVLGLTELHARALHEMSCIAMDHQDYRTAIRASQTALAHMSDPKRRQYARMNLGGALVGYGDHSMAKRILLFELQCAEEESVRQRGLINLLEIAAKDADQPAFNRYRQQLDGTLVLPDLEAHYHLFVAKGHHVFGNPTGAREAWQNALSIASAHGLTQTYTTIRLEMAAAGEKSE